MTSLWCYCLWVTEWSELFLPHSLSSPGMSVLSYGRPVNKTAGRLWESAVRSVSPFCLTGNSSLLCAVSSPLGPTWRNVTNAFPVAAPWGGCDASVLSVSESRGILSPSSPCGLFCGAAAHFPLNSSCCRSAASPAWSSAPGGLGPRPLCHPWRLWECLVQCLAPSSHVQTHLLYLKEHIFFSLTIVKLGCTSQLMACLIRSCSCFFLGSSYRNSGCSNQWYLAWNMVLVEWINAAVYDYFSCAV